MKNKLKLTAFALSLLLILPMLPLTAFGAILPGSTISWGTSSAYLYQGRSEVETSGKTAYGYGCIRATNKAMPVGLVKAGGNLYHQTRGLVKSASMKSNWNQIAKNSWFAIGAMESNGSGNYRAQGLVASVGTQVCPFTGYLKI